VEEDSVSNDIEKVEKLKEQVAEVTPVKPEHLEAKSEEAVSRRRFLTGAAGLAAGTLLAPALSPRAFGPFVARAAAPGEQKLKVLFVATEGRASNHVEDLLDRRKEICVAYCDADSNRYGKAKALAPNAPGYTDWRIMFEKHLDKADAVIVTTPDHNHALPSLHAMLAGKAVYCEKPLTWSIEESRMMAELAARKKVATQMGNQGHANEGNRTVVEWVRGGLLGDITEIHTWTDRPKWPQGNLKVVNKAKPESLNWDAWIGPAEMRPYHEGPHSFAWRGWFDYGCGAVGDMGCHMWDCVFWAMNPDYPSSVELLEVEEPGPYTFAKKTHFKWNFPAKGARPAFEAHWYSSPEGVLKPAVPEEILNDADRPADKRGLPNSGSLFIGTKGKMLVTGDYADSPRLIPEKFMREAKRPEKTIPRSGDHMGEFVRAAKGQAAWDSPGSNFSGYAGPLTEVMLLGSIAEKIAWPGFKFECDPVKREIITPKAHAMRSREYRKGFELPKIS
jgi:predicted dehydrogenase